MAVRGSLILDACTLLCALLLTGLVVRRELGSRDRSISRQPRAVANWSELQRGGHRLGLPTAPVTIVELSDFQCPFCARFASEVLPTIRRHYPQDIALVYHHWPLSVHPYAFDAAVASECAARQGRFEALHDALFRDQDSIGRRSFESFAIEAGVSDTAQFRRCRVTPEAVARVESDRRAALAVEAGGTPSFIVNGVLLPGPLDSARVDSIVRAVRSR